MADKKKDITMEVGVQLEQELLALLKEKTKINFKWNITEMLSVLTPKCDNFRKLSKELGDKLGVLNTENPNFSFYEFPDPKKKDQFEKEMKEMKEAVIKIPVKVDFNVFEKLESAYPYKKIFLLR